MKRIKTSGCCSSGSKRLENLVRIGEEGVEFDCFDVTPYADAWAPAQVRRPNQHKEKQNYKKSTSTSYKNNISDSMVSEMSQNLKVSVKKTLTKKLTSCLIKNQLIKQITFW